MTDMADQRSAPDSGDSRPLSREEYRRIHLSLGIWEKLPKELRPEPTRHWWTPWRRRSA
jgi:hypothetical protein